MGATDETSGRYRYPLPSGRIRQGSEISLVRRQVICYYATVIPSSTQAFCAFFPKPNLSL